MHEQSETYNTPKGWVNVYGKKGLLPGRVLPPEQAFERLTYPNVGEAEAAASLRSWLHGLSGGSQKLPAGPVGPSLEDLLK